MDRLSSFMRVLEKKQPPDSSADPYQRPALYYPSLTSQPFYECDRFPWIGEFTGSFDRIRAELDRCLEQRRGFEPVFPGYADGRGWAALWFHLYGERFDQNCSLCPETARLMRIPAKLNARSGHRERRFRASRTLIGAKQRRQWVS
jgi:aspartyl/asparaginyl beta-hydroxylase (cupin superfamily)